MSVTLEDKKEDRNAATRLAIQRSRKDLLAFIMQTDHTLIYGAMEVHKVLL